MILMVFLTLLYTMGFAQAAPAERNATAREIQGDWQLLPLPSALEPKFLALDPWPAECQWYSYAPSGQLKSIDKTPGPCETTSAAELEHIVTAVPAVVTWHYVMSPDHQKGFLIVTRTDVNRYMEFWEPHIVAVPFTKDGVDFAQGDLILYLANVQAHHVVWIRHLRRLN
jgi:hypothetical protein